MNARSVSNAAGNARTFRVLSYMLVFLLMACVVLTVSSLIHNVVPKWHAGLLAGISLFIVVDRLYTYQYFKSLTPLSPEWGTAVGVQWIVIMVLMRFLLSYANGPDVLSRDFVLLARGDLGNLVTPEFLIALLFALLVWVLTAQFLALLDEIGLDLKWALSEEPMLVQTDVAPPHQRLVNLIFSLGIALVILTAVARINLRATFSNTVGLPQVEWNRFSGTEAGALLYFVFGLALISLSRLMSLQVHWNRLRIPVSSRNLTRQWGIYSVVFLLALMVVVSLLPSGDSLGFFSLLASLLNFLIGVLVFVLLLVGGLISLLFSLPFLLFGRGAPSNAPPPPPLPTLPVQTMVPFTLGPTWALVRSILLWGAFGALLIFAFVHFVRQHENILAFVRRSRITNWLILAWQWLYRGMGRTGAGLSHILAEGWQTIRSRLEGKRILPRPGWINLRALHPRQQIYFFYLAMLRRGTEQGLTRKASQTPVEYALTLEKALPDVEEDVASLTEAFVEARYSRQQVDSSQANVVKETWGRIRQAFQSKFKNGQSAHK